MWWLRGFVLILSRDRDLPQQCGRLEEGSPRNPRLRWLGTPKWRLMRAPGREAHGRVAEAGFAREDGAGGLALVLPDR